MDDYEVEIIEAAPQAAAIMRGEVPPTGIATFLARAFAGVQRAVAAQGASPAGPPFASFDPHPDGSFAVQAGFPVTAPVAAADDVEPITLSGGTLARTLHVGAYDKVTAAYAAAERWLEEHGYVASGPPWESYLDQPDVPAPRTAVYYPVTSVVDRLGR